MRNLIVAIFEVNHPDGFFKANELGTTDMRGVHTEEIISWLKSLPLNLKKKNEDVAKLCSNEWSEEDERIIDTIVSVLGQYIDYKAVSGTGSGYATPRYNKEIDWLNSLRPQPKKNDMITPNKEFFQWIYDRLVNVYNEDPNVDYMISFKRRIEEIPFDEPHWKPTEEQMEAIKHAYNSFPNDCPTKSNLMFLYRDLKKLM